MSNQDNTSRFQHLLQEIKEKRMVWLLKASDGLYAMFEDDKEQAYLPVWPSESEAEKFSADDWEGYSADGMTLTEFLSWMQELKEDGILIGAYPDEDMQSMAVDPIELKKYILQP
jgi:hypothetical protein